MIQQADNRLLLLVLYSENLFHYKTRSDCVHAWRPLGIRISNSQFSRIQKIEIAISPIQCCLYERDILKMIAYVEGLRCHLKTLHLDFCLNDHEARSWEIRERPPVWQVSGSEVCISNSALKPPTVRIIR